MSSALWSATGLQLGPDNHLPALRIQAGLHWVLGGEGRGKTRLLQGLAAQCPLEAAHIERQAHLTVAFDNALDAQHDNTVAQAWLDVRRAAHPAWQVGLAAGLTEAMALTEHLAKPLYMLSAGSRRKLGLVATAASGAALRLFDTPFAALDGRSRQVLLDLLLEAAQDRQHAWVVADYALPPGWPAAAPATCTSLGD